jgi:hypothetical protein
MRELQRDRTALSGLFFWILSYPEDRRFIASGFVGGRAGWGKVMVLLKVMVHTRLMSSICVSIEMGLWVGGVQVFLCLKDGCKTITLASAFTYVNFSLCWLERSLV